MTTTTKTITKTKAPNVHRQLPEIIAKACAEFGENGYIIEYDRSVGKWMTRKKVKKGDGGVSAYEIRQRGYDAELYL
ncbi:hypothetical protein [Bacillus cereus]|uniref:hypothetical protein n=1 Tax=Bacillus cereus TaxID=1396 RepID=UPI002406C01D|nr:hypothetical protein [Bacillus cereus]MDF9542667.1 hypothetical protein [Bacillus cereus]